MNGKWIWNKNYINKNNVLMYFRKVFEYDKNKKILLKVSANQSYKFYLDGEFVQRGTTPFIESHPVFDEIELKPKNRRFCIAFEVYSMGKNVKIVTQQNQGESGLCFELEMGDEKFYSNESVKCIVSPSYFTNELIDPMANRISAWGGYKHIEDTNLEICGWKNVDFDDSDWEDAYLIEHNFGKLKPREINYLIEYEQHYDKIIELQNNLGKVEIEKGNIVFDSSVNGSFPAVILDFGKEVVGYIEIEIKGEKDSNCSIWYGESLDLYRLDTFILNGKKQKLNPYHRRAFRYIKIVVNGSFLPTVITDIKFIMTHYPLENKNHLKFNNDRIDKILETSLYTTKLAMQNHFEDSIYREQMQWLLDARIMSLVNYEFFKSYEFSEKAIRQFALAQNSDGSIPAAGPQNTSQLLPDFCMHYIIMVSEFIDATKKKISGNLLEVLKKQMNWFELAESDDGLLSIKDKNNWWCFIDWANIDKREKVTALNCLYYLCLKKYVEILDFHGLDSILYLKKAENLKHVINLKMIDSDKELYCDCLINDKMSKSYSQQSTIYAVLTGVSNGNILDKLFNDDFDGTKVNGAFMMCLTVETLLSNNKVNIAMELIDRYWGEMLRRGATTWWESFDMSSGKSSIPYVFSKNNPVYMNECVPVSHCHGWGAGIAYSISKHRDKIQQYFLRNLQ